MNWHCPADFPVLSSSFSCCMFPMCCAIRIHRWLWIFMSWLQRRWSLQELQFLISSFRSTSQKAKVLLEFENLVLLAIEIISLDCQSFAFFLLSWSRFPLLLFVSFTSTELEMLTTWNRKLMKEEKKVQRMNFPNFPKNRSENLSFCWAKQKKQQTTIQQQKIRCIRAEIIENSSSHFMRNNLKIKIEITFFQISSQLQKCFH